MNMIIYLEKPAYKPLCDEMFYTSSVIISMHDSLYRLAHRGKTLVVHVYFWAICYVLLI